MADTYKGSAKVDIRDDKEKLLHKLRISREELDTYIHHSKKIIDEKRTLERENDSLKAQLEVSNRKILRLEKFEGSLRLEFSKMCRILSDSVHCPKEYAKNYEAIMDSLSKLLDDSVFVPATNRNFKEVEDMKQEITVKRKILGELQREINDLSAFRKKLIAQNSEKHPIKRSVSIEDSQFKHLNNIRRALSLKVDEQSLPESFEAALDTILKEFFSKQLSGFKQALEKFENDAMCKTTNTDQLVEFHNHDNISLSINSIPMPYTELISKYEKTSRGCFDALLARAVYLDSKAYEFHELSNTLNEEVNGLKYALSHRLEMQQIRGANKPSECNCKEEIEDLRDEIYYLQKEVKNKETELEVAEENRHSLLQLMACMGGSSTTEEESLYVDPSSSTLAKYSLD